MEWSQVRQRSSYDNRSQKNPNYNAKSAQKLSKTPSPPVSFPLLVGVFALTISTMISVVVIEKILPPDLKLSDEPRNPGRFIAQRAMEDLVELTSLGPRVSGSYECEVQAVELLKNKIDKIMDEAKDIHVIQMDLQKASGAFPLKFLDGLTSVYRNVQNVVVRIGSRINSQHSLLINCHFDSVSDSPGASDDGAGCAVMLEILRVMSKSNRILKHNVIFLFNGAEENLMQASHGFITQHKWAQEVRAFINLEACGAGGREVLFQAGPNNPWITEIYSQTVPYPYASSLAQEIFESGFIPGETDFRIFRDFGKLSGLDFAWSVNGYVYHTKFDNVKQIPLGTLQRTGDNILALALGIANGYQLSEEPSLEGQPVFFDLLGAFVVRMPIGTAGLVSLIALCVMIANIYLNIASAQRRLGIEPWKYTSHLRKACLYLLLSWLATMGCCLGLAATLTAVGRAMAWFSRPLWIYALYVTQTVCVPSICLLIATSKQRKNPQWGWLVMQLYHDASALLWGSLLLFCMMFRIRSGFVAMLWVLCPAVAGLIRHSAAPHWTGMKRLVLCLSGFLLPFVQTYYLVLGAMYMAVPIMGRSGATIFPELVIAGLASMLFISVLGWVPPIVLSSQSPWKMVNWLLGVLLVSVGLVILTPWGFPYSGDVSRPAPQRFIVTHAHRTFLNAAGETLDESSGFWMIDLDANSPHSVDGYVPTMRTAIEVGELECSSRLFCGLPFPMPAQGLIRRTHWLPGPRPPLPAAARLTLSRKETVNTTMERLHFILTGPDHMAVMISPVEGASLVSWSLLAEQRPLANPPWGNRESYFVYLAAGSDHETPWHFHLDITHSQFISLDYLVDINVVGHYLHGPHKADSVLTSFVSNFPSWTAVSYWSSSLISYMF